MAIIALPTTTRFAKSLDWDFDRPGQVNRSQWTKKRQAIVNPWHALWSTRVEFVPIIGETAFLPWRAFLAQIKGQLNPFRLPMTEGGQAGLITGVLSATSGTYTGAAGASQLLLSTGGVNPALLAGHFVTVNDQPLLLTGPSVLDGGTGGYVITFEPPLRAQVFAGTNVELRAPTCLVALVDSHVKWSVTPGKIYTIAPFDVEEAF